MTGDATTVEAVFEGDDLLGNRWAKPWAPSAMSPDDKPDVFVRYEGAKSQGTSFYNLQAAIDHVMVLARDPSCAKRRFIIAVGPGFFEGPVVLPQGAPSIAIKGAGRCETVLAAGIDAEMSGQEYMARFHQTIHAAGAKAKEMFFRIVARQKISTANSAVFRVCSDDVWVSGLTIRNDYACDRASAAPEGAEPDAEGQFAEGQHQAVALMLDGADRVVVRDCAISSFQDTLYLRSQARQCARSAFFDCDIEGDVDFIFGGATAYFENCVIRSRGTRTACSWALAPSTSLFQPHGFVFHACYFSHDQRFVESKAFLGRQWFEGVRATPYGVPEISGYSCILSDRNRLLGAEGQISRLTLESVGKCSLTTCRFDAHLDPVCLWDDWASGAWTPRYRPVQESKTDFLSFLEDWLPPEALVLYSDAGANPWLSEKGGAFEVEKPKAAPRRRPMPRSRSGF